MQCHGKECCGVYVKSANNIELVVMQCSTGGEYYGFSHNAKYPELF